VRRRRPGIGEPQTRATLLPDPARQHVPRSQLGRDQCRHAPGSRRPRRRATTGARYALPTCIAMAPAVRPITLGAGALSPGGPRRVSLRPGTPGAMYKRPWCQRDDDRGQWFRRGAGVAIPSHVQPRLMSTGPRRRPRRCRRYWLAKAAAQAIRPPTSLGDVSRRTGAAQDRTVARQL
jgi:hypothetical protein